MASEVPRVEALIGSAFPKKALELIQNCKKSIRILVFDWRWYPSEPHSPNQLFNTAIVSAHRRHVDVRALVNLSGAVEALQSLGVPVKKVFSKDLLHAKVLIIDDNIAIIGSHNYTKSAFEKNFECSVLIDDPQAVSDFINYFEVIYNYNGSSKS